MFLNLCLFTYFMTLLLFSVISHSVYYCILLVINSLICCTLCYCVFGFSWYALLFCLVYVGGVYILFIFVSVHSPNSSVVPYWNINFYSLTGLLFLGGSLGLTVCFFFTSYECSSYLCNLEEGYFYVCLCLMLVFGFIVLSLIMSVKENYYR
uniref:NADH dehydrogenase subunit 6 n=1 Tax=Cephalochlamys namaquensis TaxID=406060 RepID=A0A8F7GNC0_9CEST|nr:NADH dehydrogenase subunit 6 [Cephalochlamys namaquensis]